MRELLRELGAMGKTIVVSSHILAELAELCDSVGIIERGRLVASGPLDELRRHAAHGRMLHLRVLSNVAEAEGVLRDQPGVGEVFAPAASASADGGTLEAEFAGDDEAIADLLAALLSRGVRVLSFSETTSDLEEVFLRLTQGEVA
jgi:ABC-2 type transport system ATP-binding protein